MQCVALHSSQSHGGQWRALARELPASIQFDSPDLIGYGANMTFAQYQTQATAPSLNDFRLSHELHELQQTAAWPKTPVVLVGHSYGGALALHWARCFPQQVQALVLYEPVAFHLLPKQGSAFAEIQAVAEKMKRLTSAAACEHFVDYWNHAGYFRALPAKVQEFMIAQQPKVIADFHALLYEPAQLADYQTLHLPVYLLSGQRSPLSSRTVAQLLAANLPQVTHFEVAAGHMGPLTAPQLITPLLVSALLSIQNSLSASS